MSSHWVEDVLAWYEDNGRDLPWRRLKDPYAVWVAEIMLQQTRVETVLPYYDGWMARFPTVEALAEASREEVLRLWEGLGYYRRAHNLHRGAQIVRGTHEGKLPGAVEELQRLPGVGRYTAAAIAAMAFGQDTIALDGNLRRVLSRLFDLELDPRSSDGERELLRLVRESFPAGQASAFNQALMDLGSMICTPRGPACERCPLAAHCLALKRGVQEIRPLRGPQRETPRRRAVAGVLIRKREVLIGRRSPGGLLGGLWGFPEGELAPAEPPMRGVRRIVREMLGVRIVVGDPLPSLEHGYSHFRVQLHPFLCALRSGEPKAIKLQVLAWANLGQLPQYPMGKLDRSISTMLQECHLLSP